MFACICKPAARAMASLDSQWSDWHPWHYAEAAPSAYHALSHPPGYHYPTLNTRQHDGEPQHDPRLLPIVQQNANLEMSVLKLLELNYQGEALRRWADGYIQTFGRDVADAEAALRVVLWNASVDVDAARPFVGTLVNALRDEAQSVQPASADRRGRAPSKRRTLEPAQSAVGAARRRAVSPLPESAARERLHSWLQAPVVEEIKGTKRRLIVGQRALLRDLPRTAEARDAWASAFCDAYFPQKQEFYMEDVSPILAEVLQTQFGLTDAGQISEEVSRLMIALSKEGACNTKRRRRRPQTQRARRGSTEPAAPSSPS